MPKLLPDQSFYPSPTMAMQAPAETSRMWRCSIRIRPGVTPLPCWMSIRVARLRRPDRARGHAWRGRRTAPLRMERVQLVPVSKLAASTYAAALPRGPGHAVVADPHSGHGARSAAAANRKVIEADEVIRKTGYSRPHTAHCGPDGIYLNALGDGEGNGPGGGNLHRDAAVRARNSRRFPETTGWRRARPAAYRRVAEAGHRTRRPPRETPIARSRRQRAPARTPTSRAANRRACSSRRELVVQPRLGGRPVTLHGCG